MGCLEAEPKMGKNRDQGVLRRNKHGKIKWQREEKSQSISNRVSSVHLTVYALYMTCTACPVFHLTLSVVWG